MSLSPKEVTLDQVYLKEGYFLIEQAKVKKIGNIIVPDSISSIATLDVVIKSKCAEISAGSYVAVKPDNYACYEIGKDCWYMLLTMDDIAFIVKQ